MFYLGKIFILTSKKDTKMKTTKFAYSLAEILVTLTIIGVIASMTIPSLQADANRRAYAAGCKKAYTTLANAVNLAEQENGPLRKWNWNDPDEIIDNVKNNLNLLEYCGEDKSRKCFQNYTYTEYGTGVQGSWIANNARYLKLPDGTQIVFYTCTGSKKGPCGIDSYGQLPTDKVYASFFVDVNGDKNPNKFGEDVFLFNLIKDKGTVPAGTGDYEDCYKGRGLTCTAVALKYGDLDYKKHLDAEKDTGTTGNKE